MASNCNKRKSTIINRGLGESDFTVADWDVNPSDLQNITDGNYMTSSTTGQTTITEDHDIGSIIIDLGPDNIYMKRLASLKIGMWSNSTTSHLAAFSQSYNLAEWSNEFVAVRSNTATERTYTIQTITDGRYLKVRFFGEAADTFNVKIYELILIPVGRQ